LDIEINHEAKTFNDADRNQPDEVSNQHPGDIWMKGYFDTLPVPVRQRLRCSPFNVCPACLVTEVLPVASTRDDHVSGRCSPPLRPWNCECAKVSAHH
jgi:hypothetical protein